MAQTLLVTKQDVLKVLRHRDEVLTRLPVPIVTTTIANNTTTIRSTRFKRGTTQTSKYDAREGEIVEQVDIPATGPTIGSAFAIDDTGFDNIDKITISPALDQKCNTATNILIYPLGMGKDSLDDAIDEMLRETDGPHVFYPSLFADSDLDAGNITAWPALSNALGTYEFTSVAGTSLLGPGSLHLIEDGDSTGIRSLSVPVHDTEEFVFMLNILPISGTWTISLHNVTGDVVIGGTTVVTEEVAWQTIQFTGSIPAECENVQVRVTAADTSECYISAHIVLQMTSGRSYSMPSWLDAESQILAWCYQAAGRAAEDADSFVALSEPLKQEQEVQVQRDERAVHPFRVNLKPANISPVALIAQREFAELAGVNTATSPINRQYAKEATLYRLLRDLGDPGASQWADASFITAERLRYGARDVIFEDPPKIPA